MTAATSANIVYTTPTFPPFVIADIITGTWPVQISRLGYGTGTAASAAAFSLNYPNASDSNRGTGTQQAGILGGGSTIPTNLNTYLGRDICVTNSQVNAAARFGGSTGTTSTTYTATSITSPTWSIDLGRVVVGMLIDTLHSPDKWTGQITAVNVATGTLTVSAWYETGQPNGTTGTPANGTDCIVNPVTQIFGQNIVVWFYPFSDTDTTNGYGMEIDVGNTADVNRVFTGLKINNNGTDFTNGGGALLSGFYAFKTGSAAIDIEGVFPCGIQMAFMPNEGGGNFLYFASNAPSPSTVFTVDFGGYLTTVGGVSGTQRLQTGTAFNFTGNAVTITTTPTSGFGNGGDMILDYTNGKLWVKCNAGWKGVSLS